jgi:hypothetical protein
MHRGYVKVWRKLEDSGILQDPGACQFFLWAMFKATHKQRKQIVGNQVVHLQAGQFISGRNAAATELGISPSKFARTLEKMKMLEFVDTRPNNKFTVITIVNWDTYQAEQQQAGQQAGQQADSKRTASEQQTDTNKKDKKVKNERIKTEENIPHAKGDEVHSQGSEPFYLTKKKRKLKGKRLEAFNRFWSAFAYPKGKAEAADAWIEIPILTDTLVEEIITAATAEAANRETVIASGNTPKWAQGWISGRRWEDKVIVMRQDMTPEARAAKDAEEMRKIRATRSLQ